VRRHLRRAGRLGLRLRLRLRLWRRLRLRRRQDEPVRLRGAGLDPLPPVFSAGAEALEVAANCIRHLTLVTLFRHGDPVPRRPGESCPSTS
jgi:hypothetical protein